MRSQWHVRPADVVPLEPFGAFLPVSEADFTQRQVEAAVRKLKRGKAAGPDDIPAEYWKTLADTPGALEWITDLMNKCWREKSVPSEWQHAVISTIYKNKGPIDECDNYRPISLLCISYKLLASLLLKRLQEAGAEDRLTNAQFGFRRGRGFSDAARAARRQAD